MSDIKIPVTIHALEQVSGVFIPRSMQAHIDLSPEIQAQILANVHTWIDAHAKSHDEGDAEMVARVDALEAWKDNCASFAAPSAPVAADKPVDVADAPPGYYAERDIGSCYGCAFGAPGRDECTLPVNSKIMCTTARKDGHSVVFKNAPVAADKPAPHTEAICPECGGDCPGNGCDNQTKDQPAGDDAAVDELRCWSVGYEYYHDAYFSEDAPFANQQPTADALAEILQHGARLVPRAVRHKDNQVTDLRAKLAEAEDRADEMEGKAGEWIAKHIHDDLKHQLREAKSDAERAKADRNGMHVKNYAEWQKAIAELHLARMDADRASELRYESRDRADRAEAERDQARAELAWAVALLRETYDEWHALSFVSTATMRRVRAALGGEKP